MLSRWRLGCNQVWEFCQVCSAREGETEGGWWRVQGGENLDGSRTVRRGREGKEHLRGLMDSDNIWWHKQTWGDVWSKNCARLLLYLVHLSLCTCRHMKRLLNF